MLRRTSFGRELVRLFSLWVRGVLGGRKRLGGLDSLLLQDALKGVGWGFDGPGTGAESLVDGPITKAVNAAGSGKYGKRPEVEGGFGLACSMLWLLCDCNLESMMSIVCRRLAPFELGSETAAIITSTVMLPDASCLVIQARSTGVLSPRGHQ